MVSFIHEGNPRFSLQTSLEIVLGSSVMVEVFKPGNWQMMAGVFKWLLFFQRAGCYWGKLLHRSVTLSTPCWVCQGCKAPSSFYTGCFSGLYLQWATLEDEVMSSSGTKKAGLLTASYKIGGFLEASVFFFSLWCHTLHMQGLIWVFRVAFMGLEGQGHQYKRADAHDACCAVRNQVCGLRNKSLVFSASIRATVTGELNSL